MVSPLHGTQHELIMNDIQGIQEDAFEIAEEWLWLFSRSQVREIKVS